jgi:preprotein translocase subunit SecG
MTTLYYFLISLFVIVALFMMLLILIQKGRGGGLSGAFGGGGGNTAFGTKTGDILTWATSIVFGVFLLLAVLLNLVANQIGTPAGRAASTANTSQQQSGVPVSGPDVPTTQP